MAARVGEVVERVGELQVIVEFRFECRLSDALALLDEAAYRERWIKQDMFVDKDPGFAARPGIRDAKRNIVSRPVVICRLRLQNLSVGDSKDRGSRAKGNVDAGVAVLRPVLREPNDAKRVHAAVARADLLDCERQGKVCWRHFVAYFVSRAV